MNKETVSIELTMPELMELIDYNHKMSEIWPKDQHHIVTAAGITAGEVCKKYKTRTLRLQMILDNTWGK